MKNSHNVAKEYNFRILLIVLIIIIAIILIIYFIVSQSSNVVPVILVITAVLFGILQLLPSVASQKTELYHMEVATKELFAKDMEMLLEQFEKNKKLYDVAKLQLELEKQQLELAKQQQSLEWQNEAVQLVEISPRAAIIIAWLGIEKEIQHTIIGSDRLKERLSNAPDFVRVWASNKIIYNLVDNHIIDNETAMTLREMRDLRNRVAHLDTNEEKISNTVALDYVQKALNIAQKISSATVEKN